MLSMVVLRVLVFFYPIYMGPCGWEFLCSFYYPFFVFVVSSIVIASTGVCQATHNVVITSLRLWNDVVYFLGDCFAFHWFVI